METEKLITTLLALIFVLSLMGLVAMLAKWLGLTQGGVVKGGQRLKMIEALSLDSRRRAVILQCDQKQYLVILSQNGETVVERNLEAGSEAVDADDAFK